LASFWGLPVGSWPRRLRVNSWDLVALPLVLIVIFLFAWGGRDMNTPYQVGDPLPIDLDPVNLPYYALRTVLRMFAALGVALAFSLAYAALAAKSRQAEKLLIPVLDILQSVPILGFLTITVTGFIALFPGSLLGVECASIFAIFTSQAWNMTFSLYQSFRTVPGDLKEASRMFHLSSWAIFWRLEVPHAMPNLVWNMMMSVSGGWFFVVASEAITVSGQTILLPGVGSYIAQAIDQKDIAAVGWAVLTMLVVILIYDQLFFRPLLAWSSKFRAEQAPDEEIERPWFLIALQRAGVVAFARAAIGALQGWISALANRSGDAKKVIAPASAPLDPRIGRVTVFLWNGLLIVGAVWSAWELYRFITASLTLGEVWTVFLLAMATAARVLILIALATLIWVPVGVWIGLRPRVAVVAQPIVQFMAAFPANMFFPIAVVLIVKFDLNVEIWVSPLMILGTQWYIAFNVISGALALPRDLHYVAGNLGVTNLLWWRRLILPGIFPAYITGAVTAAGGSWNASIVSEVVKWGDTTLTATGVGAYIAKATEAGDFPRIALGIAMLCLFVTVFNRLFWRRLYDVAAERLRLD
jgi:NitT/TauT family transport system permease protein